MRRSSVERVIPSRLAAALALSFVILAASGCSGAPMGAAKAQEVAHDFNLNARFGRMELAAESIDPKVRDSVLQARRKWGGDVRLADMELVGMKSLDKSHDDVDVSVRIAWYRPNEGELKTTTLTQRWHGTKGDYKLVEERRVDGDVGLLGESTASLAPSWEEAPPAHFPTVRLRGNVTAD